MPGHYVLMFGREYMAEKLINFAIFWLPLIAGIILGGMSPSVWYGGDKISALWMTFFGVVLLLLTGAFQVQSYIQSTILQPNFEIQKPNQKSVLTWNPPQDNSINIKGENDNLPSGNWRVPVFLIKNMTPINAQDVKFRWSASKYDSATMTNNRPIFQGRQVSVANNLIIFSAPGGVSFQSPFEFSSIIEKPFLTRTGETFIPLNVWNTAALFFVSTLPAQTGSISDAYYFDLEVSWSIPENAKPANYRIKAIATNTKQAGIPPEFKADVDFFVEKVN